MTEFEMPKFVLYIKYAFYLSYTCTRKLLSLLYFLWMLVFI